jgi:ABC-2 type transport system permease protein
MKSKLSFLINNNLKKKFSSKVFLFINVILLILIIGVVNIDKIVEFFGGDFSKPTIIYVDDNINSFDFFEDSFNETIVYLSDTIKYEIVKLDVSLEKKKSEIINDKTKDIILVLDIDDNNYMTSKIISYDYIDSILYQSIVNALNNTKTNLMLSHSEVSNELLTNLLSDVQIEREFLSDEIEENEELLNMISSIVIPVFIVPIFLLIVMSVQLIGAEINEEKSSRSMEIIISSVPAKTHFLSKIISTNIFIISQNILLLVYSFLGLTIRTLITDKKLSDSFGLNISSYIDTFLESGMLNKIVNALPIIIILILLTFLIYSLFAGILASMTTSMEDFQQLQTPIFLVLMFAYYLAIIASIYDKALFIKIFAFVPFVSGILAPVLFLLGQISYLELIISMIILVIFNYLFMHYGFKIYKVGILNYSSNKLWDKMFKAIREE